MAYASRQDAGKRLGQYLLTRGTAAELLLGLPRGGLVVAAEVASILRLPLRALVVRKIGHPWFREFAVGALAENGVLILDEQLLQKHPSLRADLDEVINEELARLETYAALFHQKGEHSIAGRAVMLVDDGLATGSTAEAAVRSARAGGARHVTLAVPVASLNAIQRLQRVADKVEAPWVDPNFESVGQYYESFPQTSDQEVQRLLQVFQPNPSVH
ncbi:MAG TPA: phosphoribosyltransferase family protein [Clostridia bacterium]|nr:phosphoribosyltransferase family protein [Clostridia bacterium]